jgi:hypothetical protein
MTEQPEWHDMDPRPPYGGVPGSDRRPARSAHDSGLQRPDAWSPPPSSVRGSFGPDGRQPRRDRGSAQPDPGLYRPDLYRPDLYRPDPYRPDPYRPDPYQPDPYQPDPYQPDDSPPFRPNGTSPWPRRDQGRPETGRRGSGRRAIGGREPGRPGPSALTPGGREPGAPEPGGHDTGPRQPGRPDWGPPEPGRHDTGPRQPGRPDWGPPEPGRHDTGPRQPGRPDWGPPEPGGPGAGRREQDQPRPEPHEFGQAGAGRHEQDQVGAGRRDEGPVGPRPAEPTRDDLRLVPPDLDERPAPAVPADGGRLAARRQREAAQSAPGPSRRWGRLSGWYGTLIVFAAAGIGTVATVAMHRNPGQLLGGSIVVGTLVAALAVRSRAVYLLIPVPAPAYLAGAVAAGLIHEHYAGPSQSGLKISAAEWIAGGFLAMAAATAVAVVVTIIRLLMARWTAPREPVPAPGPVAPPRRRSRAVSPSGPDSASWAKQPPPSRPPDGPEPPSWPWPEEPVARDRRPKQRDPAPPTEPFYRPRSSSWPEPPAWPGPSSLGGPRGLTDPVAPSRARRVDAR